jgi:hypothetical protein
MRFAVVSASVADRRVVAVAGGAVERWADALELAEMAGAGGRRSARVRLLHDVLAARPASSAPARALRIPK